MTVCKLECPKKKIRKEGGNNIFQNSSSIFTQSK